MNKLPYAPYLHDYSQFSLCCKIYLHEQLRTICMSIANGLEAPVWFHTLFLVCSDSNFSPTSRLMILDDLRN